MAVAEPFTLVSPKVPTTARVAAFQAFEAISRPYEVEIFLVAPSDEIVPDGVIGEDAALLVHPEGGAEPMRLCGKIAAFDILHDDAARTLVRALVVPTLWFLRFSRRSRIFTESSIVDVIASVLAEHGITRVDKRLGGYPVEAHVCQYRESDFDFISRWMEREGIFYFFEHREEGETLVLADAASYADDPLGGAVAYLPHEKEGPSPPSLSTFRRRHVALASAIRVRDYDYAKPDLAVSGEASVSSRGLGTYSLHGERVFTPDAGARLASLRAEEMLAREVVYQATGRRLHLRPGAKFDLEGHPRGAFNAEYLTIEARHTGRATPLRGVVDDHVDFALDETYGVELEAIPAKTAFRPVARTPWPRIDGFEHGIIDGPADSAYAQLDEHGRYAVKLDFDESELKDGKATTWIRMMQPHGGGNEGFHFPQRKGTEVLVSFLGGDPDRPVIAGVVPNAQTPSPVTSANKTLNVIQTGALNRLELDDEAGKERIALSTPHANTYLRMGHPLADDEVELHTAKNGFFSLGETFAVDVGIEGGKGDYLLSVRDSWTSAVEKGDYALSVDEGSWSTQVKGDSTHTVSSGNTKMDTQAGTTDILSNQTITIKSAAGDVNIEGVNINQTATGDYQWLTTGHELSVTAGATESFMFGNALSVSVSLSESLTIGQAVSVRVGGNLEIDVGATTSLRLASDMAVNLGVSAELKVGSALNLELSGLVSIALAAKLEIEAALAFSLNASIVFESNVLQFSTDATGKMKMTPFELSMNGLTLIG